MKTSKFLRPAAVMLASLVLFAGCGSITDQVGKQIAQKAIESATGGSMQVNPETGAVKIKTGQGELNINSQQNEVTVTTGTEQAVFGGGATRPASVHDDMPNLEGAVDFSWAGSKDGGMFSFTVAGQDFKTACQQEIDLLTAKGWTVKQDAVVEFEGMMTRTLENAGNSLSLSCSADKDNNKVTVVLIKSKKNS